MASCKASLEKLCKENGLTITIDQYRHVSVNVEAPRGMHFPGPLHELVNENETLSAAYKDALERVKENLPCEPCDEECEWWSEE
jgi:hypothetical protein